MVSSASSQKRVNSFALSRGSRRFPEHLFSSAQTDRLSVHRIEPTAREDRTSAGLHDAICERLPWNELAPAEPSRDQIISKYIASLKLIEQYRQDVDRFLTEVFLANLEFRQAKGETNTTARDQALKSKLRSLRGFLPESWPRIHNILDARVASLQVAELRCRLQESLDEAVDQFTKQFFERLALLVDHQVFGLVEWLPNHVCLYHYYKQVVIQENEGAAERVVNEVFHGGQRRGFGTGRQVVGEETVDVVAGQGTHQHRLARHEHHVIDAIRTTPRNSSVVFPVEVQRLLSRIPDWLYPFVEVIDGTLIGERIIEQDTTLERWEDSQREVRPILGYEPGVIIGPFVLTGWGPREIEQELDRRKSVAEKEASDSAITAAKRSLPWLIAASGLLAAMSLYLSVLAHLGRLPGVWPMLATAGSAVLLWWTAQNYVVASRQTSPRLFTWLSTTMLVSLLLTAEWLIAYFFHPVSWFVPLGLVALTVAAWKVGSWLESGN